MDCAIKVDNWLSYVHCEGNIWGKITRRRYTREFKISLIREFESGKNLAQLSRENNIHPTMVSRWRLEYQKNPIRLCGNGNTYKEAAKYQELERLVGKLYAENEFLKKAVGFLEKRVWEEKERSKVERCS